MTATSLLVGATRVTAAILRITVPVRSLHSTESLAYTWWYCWQTPPCGM